MRLVTFEDATPETHDVVLCAACGQILHSEEDDVFWKDNQNHACKPMLKAEIANLELTLRRR